jgi:hypothetical protein
MWVADVGYVNGLGFAIKAERLADIVIGLLGAVDGDVRHGEMDFAHINGDGLCAFGDLASDDAAEGIDGEGFVFNRAGIVKVTGKNA